MDYKEHLAQWTAALSGTEYAPEMEKLAADPALAEDSFYQFLEFGTAGMRGTLALGTNRMNIFTVRRATQGLAEYLKAAGKCEQGVCIAYDSRINSDVFAAETARVLATNGVKVYLYETLHSVPQLSFTILHLQCAAGVVITASHNPPEYNGYKVYGADGGQLATEDAATVTGFINKVEDYLTAVPMELSEAIEKGIVTMIGKEIDEAYFAKVKSLLIDPSVIASQADNLKVVYTPLYGTGNVPVCRLLSDIGIKNLQVVEEQRLPNGNFPGLSAPNPENREVFTKAFELANASGANMIIATDPDCDRMGVAVRTGSGEFVVLTGNQIGCILMDYILRAKKPAFTGDEFVVKSVVSTTMADAIAAYYGAEMRNVLTGFKFIAEQIKLSEQSGKGKFCFGFEESYGYLSGTFVRDKDAAMASMLLTEAACYYDAQGMTLYDALQALYARHGFFKEAVISLTLSGMEGIAKIKGAVEALRKDPPKAVGEFKFTTLSDFATGVKTDLSSGETAPIGLPATNMLYFEFDGGRMILRPSGTEPKLKAYVSVVNADEAIATEKLAELEALTKALMAEYTK
ncbi:MAG: phospho-sugar mutase [Christensenellaceae bacterium]|nr:phospho-sugar mutase [Christensenellaceae bacterium]